MQFSNNVNSFKLYVAFSPHVPTRRRHFSKRMHWLKLLNNISLQNNGIPERQRKHTLNNMFTVTFILIFVFAGVRPYKCHMCDKAFTQRCSLESHGRKVHGLSFNFAYKERRSKVRIGVGLFLGKKEDNTKLNKCAKISIP